MCGIIGYTGPLEAPKILIDGLTQMEYRGYDSAGIAFLILLPGFNWSRRQAR